MGGHHLCQCGNLRGGLRGSARAYRGRPSDSRSCSRCVGTWAGKQIHIQMYIFSFFFFRGRQAITAETIARFYAPMLRVGLDGGQGTTTTPPKTRLAFESKSKKRKEKKTPPKKKKKKKKKK